MSRILAIAMVGLLVGAAAAAEKEEHHHGAPPARDARFEFLKQLAGTWVGEAEGDMPRATLEFRVTAGGHAVEEREFLDTPMEMVTLYHMEGKDLVATHYCMIGNRPRLHAAEKVVENTLTFSCAGTPGGAVSHADEHVHGWAMRLDAAGQLVYTAEMVKGGEVTKTPALTLTREHDPASR